MGKDNADQIKKIGKKKEAILADNKNANNLLEILKLLQTKNTEVIICCCDALSEIFSHFIQTHKLLDQSKIAAAEADLSKEDEFTAWLKEQLSTTCDMLCEHLTHHQQLVQVAALKSILVILQTGKEYSKQSIYTNLVENMLSQLLSSEESRCELITQLPSVLSEIDGEHAELIQACLGHTKRTVKQREKPSDFFLTNCWHLVKNLATQEMDEKSRRMLTAVVCDFLKHKMPTSLYREILTSLSPVMERMSSPIRLADFLSESFDIGGAISLLSLHGLFILMHKYNLEHPDFYNKLYSMFEPQVFAAKYRARFFHLAETFLSSTHLPAYLVAAFAKRLARLSLHAPAPASHVVVPFILNLLHNHPACQVLLHREGQVKDLDTDPFLPEETDTSKCKAMESCLWELQTLEHHFNPSLSLRAKKRNVMEHDLAPLLETSYCDLFSSEAKKVKSDVAVTFVNPKGLDLPRHFTL